MISFSDVIFVLTNINGMNNYYNFAGISFTLRWSFDSPVLLKGPLKFDNENLPFETCFLYSSYCQMVHPTMLAVPT